MRIGIVEVVVRDRGEALRFYTEVLGFELVTDAAYGDAGRWLTVRPSDSVDGPELLLAAATPAALGLQEQRRRAGSPALSFTTDDCQRSFDELSARGAVFVSVPAGRGYGGIDAVFEDGCGNLLNLHQPVDP